MHLEPAPVQPADDVARGAVGSDDEGHVEINLRRHAALGKAGIDEAHIGLAGQLGAQGLGQIDGARLGRRIDLAVRQAGVTGDRAGQRQSCPPGRSRA